MEEVAAPGGLNQSCWTMQAGPARLLHALERITDICHCCRVSVCSIVVMTVEKLFCCVDLQTLPAGAADPQDWMILSEHKLVQEEQECTVKHSDHNNPFEFVVHKRLQTPSQST